MELVIAWGAVLVWLAVSGLAGFALMGFDKSRALGGGRRIPERTFFILALAGGAFGIMIGASVFRHKTKKASFLGVVLVITVLWVALLAELDRLIGHPFV